MDQRLRAATMNLACGAAAQRRFVQLGMLQRSCATIAELAPQLGTFRNDGALSSGQAALLAQLAAELDALSKTEDFIREREAGPREFLFGDALQDEGWHRVRHLARACFTALQEEPPPGGWPADRAVGMAPIGRNRR